MILYGNYDLVWISIFLYGIISMVFGYGLLGFSMDSLVLDLTP